MNHSVEVSNRTKERIEWIQSKLRLENQVDLSQIDILDFLVEKALESGDIFKILAKDKEPSTGSGSETTWEAMFNDPPDWGMDDSSEKIDGTIARGFH